MRLLRASVGPVVSRIDRYVFRQLALALVAVTTGLVALIWLTQSLRFVELVVNRGTVAAGVPGAVRACRSRISSR